MVSKAAERSMRQKQDNFCDPMGDGFYRSKDPTNSIKVLKEMLQKKKKDRLLQLYHQDAFQRQLLITSQIVVGQG